MIAGRILTRKLVIHSNGGADLVIPGQSLLPRSLTKANVGQEWDVEQVSCIVDPRQFLRVYSTSTPCSIERGEGKEGRGFLACDGGVGAVYRLRVPQKRLWGGLHVLNLPHFGTAMDSL